MIELDRVCRDFEPPGQPPVRALAELDLRVEVGDFLSIVGPSGSGKSTLLFAIGGLLRPSSGRVLLDRRDIYGLSRAARATLRREAIGFLFQTFNLIPYLDCLENVALPAVLAGSRRKEAEARAHALLDELGLGAREGHRPSELSVGERQRVALCRSLINRPRVLLADEPTGNLDPEMTQQVMGLLVEQNRQGQTIIMATHDHELAEGSRRIVALRDGELVVDRPSRSAEAAAVAL